MSEYFVITADAAHARFFRLEESELPELESSPTLVEEACLISPFGEMSEREVFTNSKTGLARPGRGMTPVTYDDHRSRHLEEFEKRFARRIGKEGVARARRAQARCMVMAASPKMLSHLRTAFRDCPHEGISVCECGKELSKMSALKVHEQLAALNLLPARRPPVAY
jgi:protein required for attachment to host cells